VRATTVYIIRVEQFHKNSNYSIINGR